MTEENDYCNITTEYPPPEEDETRCKFILDPLDHRNEKKNYRVELVPGRIEKVDGVNHYFISGSITEHTLKGYGYTYYRVNLGPVGSTRIGVDRSIEPTERFVSIANPLQIIYNSRLPVVVYMPKNAELRYRVWKAGEDKIAQEH